MEDDLAFEYVELPDRERFNLEHESTDAVLATLVTACENNTGGAKSFMDYTTALDAAKKSLGWK